MADASSEKRYDGCSGEECGGVMLFFAVLVLLLFTMCMFTIDLGSRFRAQAVMQRSVDAAVVKAMDIMPSSPSLNWQARDASLAIAKKIAYDNLVANEELLNSVGGMPGYNDEWITFEVTEGVELEVSATMQIPYQSFVPGGLFDFTSIAEVEASANGARARVSVVLVLDVSGSMNCPVYGNCTDCYRFPPFAGPQYCQAPFRLTEIQSALDDFLLLMEELHVPVKAVVFSSSSRVILVDEISYLSASGGTNIHAGMTLGAEVLEAAFLEEPEFEGYEDADKYMVVISDGAPTRGTKKSTVGLPGEAELQLAIIDLADSLRIDNGYTIFSLGFGEPNAAANNTDDPFLITGDTSALKPFLLRRMANDPSHATDPQFPQTEVGFQEMSGLLPGIAMLSRDDADSLLAVVADRIMAKLAK